MGLLSSFPSSPNYYFLPTSYTVFQLKLKWTSRKLFVQKLDNKNEEIMILINKFCNIYLLVERGEIVLFVE